MPSRPARARYLIALLSALLIFEAGAVAPASTVAQQPSEPPATAEPVTPEPGETSAPTADPEPTPNDTAAPSPPAPEPTDRPSAEPAPPAPPADEEPPGVERVDLRSADTRTYELPDGMLVTEFYSSPIFFQPEGSEEWQPIDLTFEEADEVAGRGDVDAEVVVTDSPVRLSLGDPDDADGFLTIEANGHVIRLGLPDDVPPGRAGAGPELKEQGRFVDYADFLPGGIGLRVSPEVDGFKSFLVLPERPDSNTFSFAISAPDLALVEDKNGGFEFRDREGNVVGRIPRPFMEDSSELEGRGGGLYSEAVTQSVSQTAEGSLLTLTVEEAFLDGAVYPVYVDPSMTFQAGSTTVGDSFVNSETPNTNYDTYKRSTSPGYYEMWHGNTPGTPYYNEIFIRFNNVASTLGAVKINSATLDLYPYWQYYHTGCRNSWVERVAATWSASSITWNNKPGVGPSYGIHCSTEGQWSGWDVTGYVQDIVNGVFTDHGLKIHASSLGQGGWKRIVSSNDGSNLKPKLVVNWDPFSATSPAHPIGGGPAASRTLSWANDEVAVQVAYEAALSANNFSSTLVSSGQVTSADTSWTIPAGTSLTPGTTYQWRVRTRLGANASFGAWSSIASFVWSPETNLGLGGHHSFESFDLGNGDGLSVNVATGNVVLSHPIVDLPYRGGSLSLGLTHNAFDSANVGTGPGWRLSAMARLTELAGGNVVYVGPDGSRHTFTRIGTSGTVTTYTRPSTLYATLVKDTASAPQWTLTWRDQSVDRFTAFGSDGLLTRSEDRHNNGIDYSYYASSDRLYRATDPAGRFVEFSWDTGVTPARLTQFTDWAWVSGGVVQATQTGSRRLYRFFYDANGQLIGWANPFNTSGSCPTLASHRTCLTYSSGRLTTVTKRQTVTTLASGALGTSSRDVITTLTHQGGRIAEIRNAHQTFANITGTTFGYVGAGAMRVVRPGSPTTSPGSSQHTTTTYTQVGAISESLARIGSVKRKVGLSDIQQQTNWDTSYPTERASVKDNAGGNPERTVSFTYVTSSMGLVASITEPLTSSTTRTTDYTYNSNNDVTQVIVSSAGSSTITRYCYAASTCATSDNGLTMRARIDNYQGTGAKGGADGHVANITTEYLYDSHGQLTRETRFNYASGGTLLDSRSTGYEYDAHGNLVKEIANYANGTVTSPGDDITPNGTTNARTDLTTVHAYDTAGNRISTADPRRAIMIAELYLPDPEDFVTHWTYSSANQLIGELVPTTPIRVLAECIEPECPPQLDVSIVCSSSAPDCREATSVYDELGFVRLARDFGNLITGTALDRAGRPVASFEDPPDVGGTKPAIKTGEWTLDPSGRVLTAKDRAQANGAAGQTAYAYDELGQQTSVTEAQGVYGVAVVTTTTHDALGRQTEQGYGGFTTRTRYDLGGRATEVDDGFSCTRTTYDYRDLALTVIEGLTSGTSACSGTGLRTITNTYDGLGRLVESKVTAGEGLHNIPHQATYDSAGNTLSTGSVTGGTTTSVSYTINPLDQVIRESRSDGSAGRTNYDPVGNPTDQCHWASGPDEACKPVGSSFTNAPTRHTSTSYDARNERIELVDSTTRAITEFDPNHNYQVKAVYLPTVPGKERQTIYTYDHHHRLATIVHRLCTLSDSRHNCASTTSLGSSSYTYDQNDNRTGVVENNGATSADRRYCYDAQNRLQYRNTNAACSPTAKDETYAYDAAGNRTQAVVGGTTTNFAYNADGQLCKTGATTCGTPNVTYDSVGRTRNWNGWWFNYDAEGRLTRACKDSGCAANLERVFFTYDGEGRRTKIETAPANGTLSSLELRYQGGSVVEEWTNGTLTRSYTVDEAGTILKLTIPSGQTGAGTYLVSWNGHGDALALHRQNADGTLTLANSYTYTTWGAPTTATHNSIPDLSFRYLYVGQLGVQWDNPYGLGLHYMQARHYAPAIGRFIQPDPSRLEINHYAYAGNNPVSAVDPCGTLSCDQLRARILTHRNLLARKVPNLLAKETRLDALGPKMTVQSHYLEVLRLKWELLAYLIQYATWCRNDPPPPPDAWGMATKQLPTLPSVLRQKGYSDDAIREAIRVAIAGGAGVGVAAAARALMSSSGRFSAFGMMSGGAFASALTR